MKLTDLSIRQLPPPEKGQKTYFEADGFGVRVSQGGTKTFVVVQGKERRWTTLGRYPETSLKDARSAARKIEPVHPAHPVTKTLQDAVSDFLKASERKNRPATTANYKLFLNRIKKTKLEDVTTDDVPNTAHAVMAAKVFFNWAKRNKLTASNPFEYERVSYGQRTRVLAQKEVKAIWEYEAPPFTDHLKLLLLTGQRRKQFSQFEIRGDTIWFPADVMKGGKEHSIPLLPMARSYAEKLQSFNSWSKGKAKLDKMVKIPPWVIHDARRTFSTLMASLRVPIQVTEKILDHRSGTVSGVSAVYNRHSYMEEAQEALAAYEAFMISLLRRGE